MEDTDTRALVIGNGIIGLTTAAELQARGVAVTVITAAPERDKDALYGTYRPGDPGAALVQRTDPSSVAGGWWWPYKAEPADKVDQWALRSLARFREQRGAAEELLLRDAKDNSRDRSHEQPAGDAARLGLLLEGAPSAMVSTREISEVRADPVPEWASAEGLSYQILEREPARRALNEMFAEEADKMEAMIANNGRYMAGWTSEDDEVTTKAIRAHKEFKPHLPAGAKTVTVFLSIVVDSPAYMDLLEQQLREPTTPTKQQLQNASRRKPVKFVYERAFASAGEVAAFAKARGFSVVVNCAGLAGARFKPAEKEAAAAEEDDKDAMVGGRGVLQVYPRPEMWAGKISFGCGEPVTRRISEPASSLTMIAPDGPGDALVPGGDFTIDGAKPAYMIPRGDFLVIGGAYDETRINSSAADPENAPGPAKAAPITAAEEERLHNIARAFAPQVSEARPTIQVASYRPVRRAAVKVGLDADLSSDFDLVWADNYGHGGAGWTTGWGCAMDVAEQVVGKAVPDITRMAGASRSRRGDPIDRAKL